MIWQTKLFATLNCITILSISHLSVNVDAFLSRQSLTKNLKVSGSRIRLQRSWGFRSGNNRKNEDKRSIIEMMATNTPMVPWQPPGMDYSQWIDINSRMARDRILILGNFIDEDAANSIISTILYLRKDNKEGKITIYMNIPGALLRPGLAVYDLLCQCRDDCIISTLNLGLVTGMGALLCGAGTKGHRSSMPNSRFLLQRIGIEQPFQGQASDIGLEVKNIKSSNDRMEMELAKMTGQPLSTINNDMKRDFYLSSDEAVTYGLIDNVLLPSPLKGFSELKYERDPWTGEKILIPEKEVDLGNFEGEEEQRYQNQQGGGGGGYDNN